jgi:hypothetical protein
MHFRQVAGVFGERKNSSLIKTCVLLVFRVVFLLLIKVIHVLFPYLIKVHNQYVSYLNPQEIGRWVKERA